MTSPDFEAAQQRVLARHQRQKAEVQTRLDAQRTSSTSTALSRLPYPLDRLGREGVGIWNYVRGREGTRPRFRVGQVDAELLERTSGRGAEVFGRVSHVIDVTLEIILADIYVAPFEGRLVL
jgi:peroxin-2